MKEQRPSIYQKASVWGVPFGLYLTCAGTTSVFMDWFPPLAFVFMLLILGAPLVVYYFQRRHFIEENGFAEHAALWMLGIMLYMFGTVLASFIMFLIIQYGRPEFAYDQANHIIKSYSEIPELRDGEFVSVLKRAVEQRALPTPIETVFNAFWFVTFGGCITSAITALVARRSIKRRL